MGPSITFHLTTEIMQHFDKPEVEPSSTFHITTENMYATLSKGAVTSFYLWKVFQKNKYKSKMEFSTRGRAHIT